MTPDPDVEKGLRYADVDVSPDGERIYCVRERHDPAGDGEPENALVVLPADGDGDPRVVAEGHDFYSFPRLSPDGERIAWTTWDHPSMPWDGTTLHVASVADDGALADERTVMGGTAESVFQPEWGPDGNLYAVSDRTGWWNLYRVDTDGGDPDPLYRASAEFGVPQWVFGLSTYAFLPDGEIAVLVVESGEGSLAVLSPPDGDRAGWDGETPWELRYPDLPFGAAKRTYLVSDGEAAAMLAGSFDRPSRLVRWTPGEEPTVLRWSSDVDLDPIYVSRPRAVDFATGDDEIAHAFYYPPHNPDVTAPMDDDPPVVVTVHGGPTSQTHPTFDLETQFWTTRGIGVLDVNYRGSTGYGREYRDRLKGEWGEVDVADCAHAARDAGEELGDPDRTAIRGGSAGGFAVLAALAFHDDFDAGTSYYGVSDLVALAEHTHKFESRYLDSLVGPYPEAEDRYRDRSPLHHADRIGAPLLLLQGSDDPVVPPEQSERMTDALDENGVPHAYVEFEGEQHGFRRSESIRRALEAELDFYGRVFGFDPDDDVEGVELSPSP